MNWKIELMKGLAVLVLLGIMLAAFGLMMTLGASDEAKIDKANLEKMGYAVRYYEPFTGHESMCMVQLERGEVPCSYVVGAKILE